MAHKNQKKLFCACIKHRTLGIFYDALLTLFSFQGTLLSRLTLKLSAATFIHVITILSSCQHLFY